VKAQIMIEGLDEEHAKPKGELMEKLNHKVHNHKLIVLAPHGGNIEPWTDVEAEHVAKSIFQVIVLLYGYVRALKYRVRRKKNMMQRGVGISLQLKLVENHSPNLTRLWGTIRHSIIPLPFMVEPKIPYVLEVIHITRTMI